MRIQNLNNIIKPQQRNNYQTSPFFNFKLKSQPQNDVFEKQSQISFKGLEENFMEDLFVDMLNGVIKDTMNYFNKYYYNFFIENAIEMFATDKTIANALKQPYAYQYNMRDFIQILKETGISDNPTHYEDFYCLVRDCGLLSFKDFQKYSKLINNNQNARAAFEEDYASSMRIYAALDDKEDIKRYPELLAYLKEKDNKGKITNPQELNEICSFLRKIGVNSIDDFKKKYAELACQFDDFDNMASISEAIRVLWATYDKKIAYINEILANRGEKKVSASKIYSEYTNFIEYSFTQNRGENLSEFDEYYEYITQKIKPTAKNALAGYFNDLKTTQDYLNLFGFLKSENISPDECAKLFSKTLVNDDDKTGIIINQKAIVEIIAKRKNLDEKQAKEYYQTNPQVFNAVFEYTNSQGVDDINLFRATFNLLDTFKIGSPNKFLNLYNGIFAQNAKNQKTTLTQQEVIDLIQLCVFSQENDDIKNLGLLSKKLRLRQAKYNSEYKNEILNFISENPEYFVGLTPFEIYKEFNSTFEKNPTRKIQDVLDNILTLNVKNSNQYSAKTAELEKFSSYFINPQEALDFINQNQITFVDEPQAIQYKDACLDILSTLKKIAQEKYSSSRAQEQELSKLIQTITKNGFLKNSQETLASFTQKAKQEGYFDKAIEIIATKNIGDIYSFEKFLKGYQDENGSINNILDSLFTSNLTLEEYKKVISKIKAKLKELNINVDINGSNINRIRPEKYKNSQLSANEINEIISSLLGNASCKNFVSLLNDTFSEYTTNNISANRIAYELITRKDIDKTYRNLLKALKLDKASLKLDDKLGNEYYIDKLSKSLPKEFVELINSNSWSDILENGQYINIGVHQRLRLIARFGLKNGVENLYSNETQGYLKDILKTIYFKTPSEIAPSKNPKTFTQQHVFDDMIIESVFFKDGHLATIYPKF